MTIKLICTFGALQIFIVFTMKIVENTVLIRLSTIRDGVKSIYQTPSRTHNITK